MDPLSIVASSIALSQFITQTLGFIHNTRRANSDLLALSNEVTDLAVVLGELQEHMKERVSSGNPLPPTSSLFQLVTSSNAKLNALRLELGRWYDESAVGKPSKQKKRFRVLRVAHVVQGFREDLRSTRQQLAALVAVSSADLALRKAGFRTGTSRIEVDLRQILWASQDNAKAYSKLRDSFQKMRTSEESAVHITAASSTDVLQTQDGRDVHLGTSAVEESLLNEKSSVQRASALFDSSQMTALCAVGIRVAQYPRMPCTPWCSCRCHTETRLRSPEMLESIFGALFVGYSGMPNLNKPSCDDPSCHLQAPPMACMTYYFPSWFLARMVSVTFANTRLAGPVVSLKCQRTVPGSADIFTYAKMGDVERLKGLFDKGLASPHDVHAESGLSALGLAVGHRQIAVCKFLIQANADPFLEDRTRWCAADEAWDKILSKAFAPDTVDALKSMFPETECVERREFTILHKIVLDLVAKDLEHELLKATTDINATDSNGRTALSLAAGRGDSHSVSLLLEFGADADIASTSGSYPLHFAASVDDPSCVGLLVPYSDINVVTNWKQTALVYVAAYTKDSRHAELLLAAGCDPEIKDLDGMTAVDWTAISGNEILADELLKIGVDIEHFDHQDKTMLTHAIVGNQHGILRKLLNPSFEERSIGHLTRESRVKMLQAIAKEADAETLTLLTRSKLQFSDVDVASAGGKSALFANMLGRAKGSSSLFKAFVALVSFPPHARYEGENTDTCVDPENEEVDLVWYETSESIR